VREVLAARKDLAAKFADLEKKYDAQFRTHDAHFRVVFEAIQALMEPSSPSERRQIGFGREKD
jgi:hypothetical protein